MNYFSKLADSASSLAKKGANLIGNIVNNTNSIENQILTNEQEFDEVFRTLCNYLDYESTEPDSHTIIANERLRQSPVKEYLRRMIELVRLDAEQWLETQKTLSTEHNEINTPVIDRLLHANIVRELCQRAIKDSPRGTLPMLLVALSSLLRTVKFPLLPHQSIYKPITNLISYATRYEELIEKSVGRNQMEKNELLSYKRRVSK
jgi:hypothetical protein